MHSSRRDAASPAAPVVVWPSAVLRYMAKAKATEAPVHLLFPANSAGYPPDLDVGPLEQLPFDVFRFSSWIQVGDIDLDPGYKMTDCPPGSNCLFKGSVQSPSAFCGTFQFHYQVLERVYLIPWTVAPISSGLTCLFSTARFLRRFGSLLPFHFPEVLLFGDLDPLLFFIGGFRSLLRLFFHCGHLRTRSRLRNLLARVRRIPRGRL